MFTVAERWDQETQEQQRSFVHSHLATKGLACVKCRTRAQFLQVSVTGTQQEERTRQVGKVSNVLKSNYPLS